MRLRILIPFLLIVSIIIYGCENMKVKAGPKREAVSYSEKILAVAQPLQLCLTSDSSNIEVYSWDRNEAKFEITKRVRGIQTKDVLEGKLKDFDVSIKQEGSKVEFESRYKGKIKNPADRSVDLKVFIPKKISSFNIKLDIGKIKVFDDIKCNLDVLVKMANVDINRFEGVVNFNADIGDLRIAGGKIYQGSNIKINMGNIQIKAEYEDEGNYCFETKMGNIDLSLPGNSLVTFENVGTTEVNDFPSGSYKTKVKLLSGMGKIAIRKY